MGSGTDWSNPARSGPRANHTRTKCKMGNRYAASFSFLFSIGAAVAFLFSQVRIRVKTLRMTLREGTSRVLRAWANMARKRSISSSSSPCMELA